MLSDNRDNSDPVWKFFRVYQVDFVLNVHHLAVGRRFVFFFNFALKMSLTLSSSCVSVYFFGMPADSRLNSRRKRSQLLLFLGVLLVFLDDSVRR